MAAGEKPYRVYRGGRTKGKVPLQRRAEEAQRSPVAPSGAGNGRAPVRRRRRRWSWKRRIGVGLGLLVVLLVVWGVAGYFAVRSGVSGAHKRLPANVTPALTHQNGLLLSHPSDILLLGTDHSSLASRATDQHSDSIMLLRTDPGR